MKRIVDDPDRMKNLPREKGRFIRATPRGGRIAEDPARLKRCTDQHHEGPHELPVTSFHTNRQGFPQGRCKACHRVAAASSRRAKYRSDPAYAATDRARVMVRHWGKRGAHLDAGTFVRVCPCHRKVCRLWGSDDTVRCAVTGRRVNTIQVVRAA